MKFASVTLIAALAGLSAAQSLSGLPTCAQGCAGNSIPASCGVDVACICKSSSFIQGVTCCVATTCDQADQETTLKFAQQLCGGAGVTTLPTAATCASSASSTATGSSSSATGAASNSTTTTSGAAASSISSSLSAASSSVSSGASAASSSAASGASLSSATTSGTQTSPSASATAKSGGNGLVAQGAGALGVAVAGAFALL